MIAKELYGNYIIYPTGIVYNIDRLVAMCFIDNKENKPFVNHIDGNKFNNNKENLEWVTHIENVKHAMENNLMNNKGESNPSSKLKKEDVSYIKKLYETKEYSHRELAKKFKISKTQIGRVINNKSWAV